MKKLAYGLLTVFAITVLFSCTAKRNYEEKKILKQEALLMEAAKQGKVDTAGVNELLRAYEAFADKYPGDTTSAAFLFKAADFYRYMQKPLRSISIYENIYNNFPELDKRPYALFLQGFIFENEVGNTEAAKHKYQEFLKQYPTHPIAKDVEAALGYLGKSPEQLMQEFMAKQQQDSLSAANGK